MLFVVDVKNPTLIPSTPLTYNQVFLGMPPAEDTLGSAMADTPPVTVGIMAVLVVDVDAVAVDTPVFVPSVVMTN